MVVTREIMQEAGAIDMKRFMWEKMAHGKILTLQRIEEELGNLGKWKRGDSGTVKE